MRRKRIPEEITPEHGTSTVKNLIFLDIDGVLNSENYFRTEYKKWLTKIKDIDQSKIDRIDYYTKDIDSDSLEMLSSVITELDIDIVISSSWRVLHSIDEIKTIFLTASPTFPVYKIIGQTPRIYGKRGTEIKRWLDINNFSGRYLILDDDSDMLSGQSFLKIDRKTGITESDIEKIKQHFRE